MYLYERKNAAKCGTQSGYARHTREKSPKCQPCKDAKKAASSSRASQVNAETARVTYLANTYNMTAKQYEEMFTAQEGLCAICGNPETRVSNGKTWWLAVDHDHTCCSGSRSCGKCARQLLCHSCNPGLGYFKDDIALSEAATEYLRKWAK